MPRVQQAPCHYRAQNENFVKLAYLACFFILSRFNEPDELDNYGIFFHLVKIGIFRDYFQKMTFLNLNTIFKKLARNLLLRAG